MQREKQAMWRGHAHACWLRDPAGGPARQQHPVPATWVKNPVDESRGSYLLKCSHITDHQPAQPPNVRGNNEIVILKTLCLGLVCSVAIDYLNRTLEIGVQWNSFWSLSTNVHKCCGMSWGPLAGEPRVPNGKLSNQMYVQESQN